MMTYQELIDFLNEHEIDFEIMQEFEFPLSIWLKFKLLEEDPE